MELTLVYTHSLISGNKNICHLLWPISFVSFSSTTSLKEWQICFITLSTEQSPWTPNPYKGLSSPQLKSFWRASLSRMGQLQEHFIERGKKHLSMLGCFSLFISCISLSMLVRLERCLFIFSTITFPVTCRSKLMICILIRKIIFLIFHIFLRLFHKVQGIS